VLTVTNQATLYNDQIFAPLDPDCHLERIGGGFETDVYCSDDRRFVIKLKSVSSGAWETALAEARQARSIAEQLAHCLGVEHSIPSTYLVARASDGRAQNLVLQPFIEDAQPLYAVDFNTLSAEEREHVAEQLSVIVRRSVDFYHQSGYMPDLYGMTSSGKDERARLSRPHLLPWHIWTFLFKRNLLRSHNLLLTGRPERRVVLIDYDLVRWPPVIRRIYFAVRMLLTFRDRWMIRRMRSKDRGQQDQHPWRSTIRFSRLRSLKRPAVCCENQATALQW
jgi:hypothetical protein